MSDRDELAKVLSEHVRGDWSDRTFACCGCRARYEEATQAEWEALTTREEKMAYRAALSKHMKPDWSMSDYNQHVAWHVLASDWLAAYVARAQAEALLQAADEIEAHSEPATDFHGNRFSVVGSTWLRNRADQIEAES